MLTIKSIALKSGNFTLNVSNLEFGIGQINLLYGKNASGKSLLCNALVEGAAEHEVLINNKKVVVGDFSFLDSRYVNFFEMTGFSYLFKYGGKQNLEFIKRNLEFFDIQLHDKVETYPASMKKIIQFLHSLTYSRPIYVFDDLLCNMDHERRHFIMDMLRKMANKRIVLLTTSDNDMIHHAGVSVYCLDQQQLKKVSSDTIWAYN
jgi:ABC-type multidrug transport system, ATPase component